MLLGSRLSLYYQDSRLKHSQILLVSPKTTCHLCVDAMREKTWHVPASLPSCWYLELGQYGVRVTKVKGSLACSDLITPLHLSVPSFLSTFPPQRCPKRSRSILHLRLLESSTCPDNCAKLDSTCETG